MVTTDSSELTRYPQVRPIKLAVRLVGSWRLCCCPSTVTELCFTLLQSYKSHSNFCSIGHCFISGSYDYEFTIIIFGCFWLWHTVYTRVQVNSHTSRSALFGEK